MKTVKTAILSLLSLAVATACAPDEPPSGGNIEQTTVASADYDTGKYKTTPGKLLHDTDESNVRNIESRVLSEYVPLPFEVDPALNHGALSTVLYNSPMLLVAFTQETQEGLLARGSSTGITTQHYSLATTQRLPPLPSIKLCCVLRIPNQLNR